MTEQAPKVELREADEIAERCEAVVYDPDHPVWDGIKDQLMAINSHWGEEAFEVNDLFERLHDPKNVCVLLYDNDRVVGYSIALPLDSWAKDEWWPTSRDDNGERTAYAEDVTILQGYRGHRLVGKLLNSMEAELIHRGYEYLELDATMQRNFGAKLANVYHEKLLESAEHDSIFGPQMFIRTHLDV